MIIQCPSCQTRFSVDASRVSRASRPRFHCSRCDHFFHLSATASGDQTPNTPPPRANPTSSAPLECAPDDSDCEAVEHALDSHVDFESDTDETEDECQFASEEECEQEECEENEFEEDDFEEESDEDESSDDDEEELAAEEEEQSGLTQFLTAPELGSAEIRAQWPDHNEAKVYESDLGRTVRRNSPLNWVSQNGAKATGANVTAANLTANLTVRQSGSFIPETPPPAEDEYPEQETIAVSSLRTLSEHEFAEKQESTFVQTLLPPTSSAGPDSSTEAATLPRHSTPPLDVVPPPAAPKNPLEAPLHRPTPSTAPAAGVTGKELGSAVASLLEKPLRARAATTSNEEQPTPTRTPLVNFPFASPPPEFKRRRGATLTHFKTPLTVAGVLSLPVALACALWGLSANFSDFPRLARYLDLGATTLPRVPPQEIEVVDLSSEQLTLEDGTKVIEIMGRVINASSKPFTDVTIEARLYNQQNETVQTITAPLNNKLFQAGMLRSLTNQEITALQSSTEPNTGELKPKAGVPFRVIVLDREDAHWFGARVKSVSRL